MGDTDEICPVYAQHYRCNNYAEHSTQSSKLSVVRTIRRHFRRRDELWVHDISTMPSYLEWDGRLLRAEYTLRASTRPASVDEDKALSVLSPNQLRLPQ